MGKINIVFNLILVLGLWTLSGCVDESGRKGRPIVQDFTKIVDDTTCRGFFYFNEEKCYDKCPAKTHVGTTEEVNLLLDAMAGQSTDKAGALVILNNMIAAAAGVCDRVCEQGRPGQPGFEPRRGALRAR
ncbi:MAG: hypothetical protein WCG27_05580, partial [Pseudomonadota bacterium]